MGVHISYEKPVGNPAADQEMWESKETPSGIADAAKPFKIEGALSLPPLMDANGLIDMTPRSRLPALSVEINLAAFNIFKDESGPKRSLPAIGMEHSQHITDFVIKSGTEAFPCHR